MAAAPVKDWSQHGMEQSERAEQAAKERAVLEQGGISVKGKRRLQSVLRMEQVAEGVCTCGPALALARQAGVAAPVMEQVDAILRQGKKPKDAVVGLMRRDPRAERD